MNYETVKKRRLQLTDPEDFFRFQREMYDRLSKRLGAIKINTAECGIAETALAILKAVEEGYLPQRKL